MISYVLLPAEKEDLADIRNYYLEEAGYRVARQIVLEFAEPFRPLNYLTQILTSSWLGAPPPAKTLSAREPGFAFDGT